MPKELKAKQIREMSPEERRQKLSDLREELMHEMGISAMGGAPPSPGKIRSLKRQIARILTVMNEEGAEQ